MDLFKEYHILFTCFVDVATMALRSDGRYASTVGFVAGGLPVPMKQLYNSISVVRQNLNGGEPMCIEHEDIEQQVRLIWLEALKSFTKSRSRIYFRDLEQYLILRTIWGMKDWAIAEARQVRNYPYYYFTETKPGFVLDLNFILHGTKVYPLSALSAYERYLIYLRFRDEKTLAQIAKAVYKRIKTVRRELKWILDKLRRLANEEKNPSRPCGGRAGRIGPSGYPAEDSSSRDSVTAPEAGQ